LLTHVQITFLFSLTSLRDAYARLLFKYNSIYNFLCAVDLTCFTMLRPTPRVTPSRSASKNILVVNAGAADGVQAALGTAVLVALLLDAYPHRLLLILSVALCDSLQLQERFPLQAR
jgi:hypothetical protein